MGKIRRQRKKLHLSANPEGPSRLYPERDKSNEKDAACLAPNIARVPKSYDNIFEGVDIPKILAAKLDSRDNAKTPNEYNNLATSLALLPQSYNVFEGVYSKNPAYNISSRDDDARTTISVNKSVFKNGNANKKERRKLRHQTFIERIHAIQAMKMKQKKKNKNRFLSKEEPSTSTTNTISLPQECAKTKALQEGRIVKSRVRHKRMLKDIAVLTKLWENPEYKADPTGFVCETIHERLTKEID